MLVGETIWRIGKQITANSQLKAIGSFDKQFEKIHQRGPSNFRKKGWILFDFK